VVRRKDKLHKLDRPLIVLAAVAAKVDWSTLSRHLSFVDQDSHRSTNVPLDQNAPEFPWITKNIDFMKWESDEKSQALWLSGPCDGMKEVASQVIAKEKAIRSNGCILYFFCVTAGKAEHSIATVFAHTLLHQIVCFSGAGDQAITTAFLASLLEGHIQRRLSGFKKDDTLDTMVKKILDVPDGDLHTALVKAIAVAKLQDLSLIVDGISIAESRDDSFVRNISLLVDHMINARAMRFKALLTSPQHLELKGLLGHLPSIEFDQERKGCASIIHRSEQELINLVTQNVFVFFKITMVHDTTRSPGSMTVRLSGYGRIMNTATGRNQRLQNSYTSKGSLVVERAPLQNISREMWRRRYRIRSRARWPPTSTPSEVRLWRLRIGTCCGPFSTIFLRRTSLFSIISNPNFGDFDITWNGLTNLSNLFYPHSRIMFHRNHSTSFLTQWTNPRKRTEWRLWGCSANFALQKAFA